MWFSKPERSKCWSVSGSTLQASREWAEIRFTGVFKVNTLVRGELGWRAAAAWALGALLPPGGTCLPWHSFSLLCMTHTRFTVCWQNTHTHLLRFFFIKYDSYSNEACFKNCWFSSWSARYKKQNKTEEVNTDELWQSAVIIKGTWFWHVWASLDYLHNSS